MSSKAIFLMLLVYVDDLLISGTSAQAIQQLKDALDKKFTIKDLGEAQYFLGLEITKDYTGIFVNQRKYVLDLLTETGLLGSKPKATPFPSGVKLTEASGELLDDPHEYRRIIGRLLYFNFTRPDITYYVQQLSQFLHMPRTSHLKLSLHLLKRFSIIRLAFSCQK